MKNMEDKIQKSWKKLETVNHWIANCDTKSSFVLALLGIIITIIFTSNIGEELIQVFSYKAISSIDFQSVKHFLKLICVCLFFIGIIITLYHIYQTFKGRVDSSVYKQENLNTNSTIFFGNIANKKYSDFEDSTNNETEEEYINDINSQVFINSKIVVKKFSHYNKSLKFLMLTLIFFLLASLLN